MKILLVGTGLIGGSFSLGLKRREYDFVAGGYSRNPANLERSKELGVIDEMYTTLADGCQWADMIVLSIPVDAIKSMLPEILDGIRGDQIVVDFGSTKAEICAAVADHPRRGCFIAAHPIAGTEYSGPDAAFDSLYDNKVMVLCEAERSDEEKVALMQGMCEVLQMRITRLGADEHDRHLAYISHLSHITSYVLSNAVLQKEKDGEVILDLAGSGFASTVRLAKSSPEMWTPIFIENKAQVLESVDTYLKTLEYFRDLLDRGDEQEISGFLAEGRKIRKILD